MKIVNQYTIPINKGVQKITIRRHGKLLKVAPYGKEIGFWYEVDTHEDWKEVLFILYETGQEFDKDIQHRARYVDTVHPPGHDVVHIYRID